MSAVSSAASSVTLHNPILSSADPTTGVLQILREDEIPIEKEEFLGSIHSLFSYGRLHRIAQNIVEQLTQEIASHKKTLELLYVGDNRAIKTLQNSLKSATADIEAIETKEDGKVKKLEEENQELARLKGVFTELNKKIPPKGRRGPHNDKKDEAQTKRQRQEAVCKALETELSVIRAEKNKKIVQRGRLQEQLDKYETTDSNKIKKVEHSKEQIPILEQKLVEARQEEKASSVNIRDAVVGIFSLCNIQDETRKSQLIDSVIRDVIS